MKSTHRIFRFAVAAAALVSVSSLLQATTQGADEHDKKVAESGKAKKPAYVQHKDVIYGESGGVALTMDVFTPAGPRNGLGIVDVVSGAWFSDRNKIEDHRRGRFFDIFCSRGYTVFAIRPGSRTKFSVPEMVKNLRTGIAWVREHADDYGVDPANLGITGASAGGHLACLTLVTTEAGKDGKVDQPFKAAAIFFPPTDFLSWGGVPTDYSKSDPVHVRDLAIARGDQAGKKIDKKELDEKITAICPARLVKDKQPPFLIIHGDADPLVPLQQSQLFVDVLKKAGGSAELIVKAGGGHPWPTIAEEVKVMADWLDKELKKPTYDQQMNVVYGEADGVALVMDVFTPTGPKNGLAMIDIASGAYHSDRGKIRDHKRAKVYDVFCGKGYTVFAIRPGSINMFTIPEMVAHLRTGIKWVRSHAAEYGIDPNNMGITGGSAGGHLACLTVIATKPGDDGKVDQPFKAVGVFFPPTDFLHYRGGNAEDQVKNEQFAMRMRSMAAPSRAQVEKAIEPERLLEMLHDISPALLVDRQQPPFLIIHGDADPAVPLSQSETLIAALKKAGGSAELIVKPGGGHPWPTIAEEVKVMADWFDKELKAKPQG
jgi:acetyl esterase/lipase